jgi:hypothetical protein
MQVLRKSLRFGTVAVILAGLLGVAGLSRANAQNAKKPAPAAKPAAKAPAAKPAATPAVRQGAGGGTAARAGTPARTATTSGGARTTTTTGARTTTTGGARTTTTTASKPTTTGPHSTSTAARPGSAGPKPAHSTDKTLASGKEVRTRGDGKVSDIHDPKSGMDVHRGLNGNRRVSVERHDGSRLVAERGRRGYVQRGYSYHGHDFGRRSYYYHGHEYNRYYRGYYYRGAYMNVYAPGFYYSPGFYGWAYNPWAVPIAFGWGWGVSPWYGFYGAYFQPYPVYPSAAFWLTDYIISQDLQAAYAAHVEAGEVDGAAAAAGGTPELTPDVKQQIADEVKNQLALENQEAGQTAQNQDVDPASSGIARLLADGRPHVFVAGDALDVVDANGQECALSDGDALVLRTPPAPDATAANVVVLAGKGGKECPISSTVTVQLTDLQEMQNHMRETIDQGLQDLQAKQGTGGLPQAPPSAQAKPVQPEYASIAPPPDPNDAADIQQQGQQADQVEKDANAETVPAGPAPAASAAPAAAPASVGLGQTTDQVKAALGAPTRIANLGPKVIYYYDGMKVTFKDGKVSDVQ